MHFKTTTSLLCLCLRLLTMYFALSQHVLVCRHYLCWHDAPCHHRPNAQSVWPPAPVTHLDLHLPSKFPLFHWFCSSTVSPPTQRTSCPSLPLRVKCVPADGVTHSSVTCHMSVDLCFWERAALCFLGVRGLHMAVRSRCTSQSWGVCWV